MSQSRGAAPSCRASVRGVKWVCALLALVACARRVGDERPAVVVVARRIRTQDAARPIVQALAMRGGKIIKVGTRDEAIDAAGSGALIDEWPDAVVVPGLVDSHG